MFNEELKKRLVESDAGKTGSLTLTKDMDKDQATMAVAVHVYEMLRDSVAGLMKNNGVSNSEKRIKTATGAKEIKNRPVIEGIGALREAFKDMVSDAAEIVNEASPKLGLRAEDLFTRIQFPQLMQRAIELPAMMPIEPVYVLQDLFRKMNTPGMFGVQEFKFPIIGAFEASVLGEDAEVQEKDMDIAGGSMRAVFKKVGVGARWSDDFAKVANFDWLGMTLQMCRQALARRKEAIAYDHISTNGSTIIDNTGRFGFSGSIQSGTVGSAGTGVDGLRNGTHVLQDLFYMMASFNDSGMMPDTIVLSPRAWMIWAQSPEMRAYAWQNGMPQMWQMPQGRPNRDPEFDIMGGVFGANVPTYPTGSTQYTTPPQMGIPNMRIVVSPFVTSGTDSSIEYTNAHVLDVATGVGYLLQVQDIMMNEWKDPEHDITKMKFTERYAFGVLQDSLTIRHMKLLKTREIGVDARDRLWFGTTWAGGAGGPEIGNGAVA